MNSSSLAITFSSSSSLCVCSSGFCIVSHSRRCQFGSLFFIARSVSHSRRRQFGSLFSIVRSSTPQLDVQV